MTTDIILMAAQCSRLVVGMEVGYSSILVRSQKSQCMLFFKRLVICIFPILSLDRCVIEFLAMSVRKTSIYQKHGKNGKITIDAIIKGEEGGGILRGPRRKLCQRASYS